jgi:hypothetical protein
LAGGGQNAVSSRFTPGAAIRTFAPAGTALATRRLGIETVAAGASMSWFYAAVIILVLMGCVRIFWQNTTPDGRRERAGHHEDGG